MPDPAPIPALAHWVWTTLGAFVGLGGALFFLRLWWCQEMGKNR